ncbi:LysR family transcriptional regulator [Microbispora hainanensis]|uniref:LysR family transcriptional regulator n=1 Tax=Microbispora hainanensis TaxID=568844 RepID=A0A544YQ67_9ACTN|nr:LysR family transcriptional regulator [Microbispora hainanensis]TQS18913.1 LysR family transcriptional regulator [Microbispora hainanensis]
MNGASALSLRQLQYFCAVVESGSVTEAARRLHVSAGGVSLAITQLEELLDVQLTLRTRGKGVEITDAGRSVYETARVIARSLEDIQEMAATIRGELSGPLRVGIFTTLSPWLFPQMAEYFAEHHPAIDLQLEEGASAALQTLLTEGRLDAALLYENHVVAEVDVQRLAPVRLQLAVSPDHPLAGQDKVWLSALRDEYAVLLAMRPATDHVEEILRNAGITPRVRWRSANVETIRSLVARGLGYTIIMGRPHGDLTYDGKPIVYRPIADEIPPNHIVLATAPGARRTARVEALRAYCREAVAGHFASRDGMPVSKTGML